MDKKRANEIRRLYRRILDREADIGGLQYWEQSKLSIPEIDALMKQSDEHLFLVQRKQRMEEIKSLYRLLLNREAEESALDHWIHSRLSISEIEKEIRESKEYKRIETIKNTYLRILGRQIQPTELYLWSHLNLPVDDVKTECQRMAETLRTQFSKYKDRVCAHTIKPLHEIIEEAFEIDSKQWTGSLHIHMPGKAGEILFLMGLLPSLRKMVPKSKIVFHTLPHYVNLIENVESGPDSIEVIKPRSLTLADSVVNAIFIDPIVGFEISGNDLRVCPYRTHKFFNSDRALTFGPFYRAFAEAIGIVPFSFEKPSWIPLQRYQNHGRIALALATSNRHSSVRQVLPLTPLQWKRLSEILKERGLNPIATGHKEDPPQGSMPGWQWIDCNLVDAVTMVLRAKYVLGFVTGLSFVAASIGKAQTVIFDETNYHHNWFRYGFEPLNDILDSNRMWAILTNPDGSMDEQAYQLAFRVAQNPDLRGGFTIGYSLR